MDKPKVTPKDFFLWAGAMVALYWSVVAFIFLIFDYINYSFPDPLAYYSGNPYTGGISYEMASIIVLFPIYVALMWAIRRDIVKDPSRKDIWVRRWALILTLFVAGVTIAVDLITLLTAFLQGDVLTEAFLLKVILVFLVAAGGFMHFIADMWGYWDMFPARKRAVCVSAGVLAAVTIVAGFFIVGTPQQARSYQYDAQKVNDLMSVQSEIVSYWQAKSALPATLADLNDAISGFTVPTDEQTGATYGYTVTGKTSFQLCANFNAVTQSDFSVSAQTAPVVPVSAGAPVGNLVNSDWYHAAGNVCFTRTIDPARYPPLNKTQ